MIRHSINIEILIRNFFTITIKYFISEYHVLIIGRKRVVEFYGNPFI